MTFTAKDRLLALKILGRSQPVQVKHRTIEQANIYRKIYRYGLTKGAVHDQLTGKKVEHLMRNDKIVLSKNEVVRCIETVYNVTKGEGARKLNDRLYDNYYGIGRRTIQEKLNQEQKQQLKNPKFLKKAPLKSISAKRTMEHHQIDLVNLDQIPVIIDNCLYRYVMGVMDVFSRFLWLRQLATKYAVEVAEELKNLYSTKGYPHILQCDNGGEFKGEVKAFCSEKKRKLINSRAYHPRAKVK